MDEISTEITEGDSGIPMTSEETTSDAQAVQSQPTEFEFTWNGKQIKAPQDKMTKWASQGYDYAQKMQDFNQRQAEFDKRSQGLESKLSRYGEVDQFATKNPDWWAHVEKSWQERQQALDPSNPIAGELSQIKNDVNEIKQFKEQLALEREQARIRQEDEQLDNQIQEVKKQYSYLDWSSVDADGKTLDTRVIEHASNNGINSFKAAFLELNHDHLMQLAESRARESSTKERQLQSKLGLLGRTPTPRKGLTVAENVKSKSYNDLTQEALAELNSTVR